MSLQIWLPLDGNIDNYGLTPVEVVNTGATITNSGKTGKCYTTGSNNKTLRLTSLSSTKSVSFWLKTSQTNYGVAFIDYKSKLAFGFWNSHRIIVSAQPKSIKTYMDTNFNFEKWNHIVLTVTNDSNDILLYINGVLQIERDTTNYWATTKDECQIGGRLTPGYSENYLDGQICDVRIYDHILSQKEINEIYRGLILHYKFDTTYNGIISDCSGYKRDGSLTGEAAIVSDGGHYSKCLYIPDGRTDNVISPILNLPGDAITMNYWFKSSNTKPGSGYHMPMNSNSKTCYEMSINKSGYLRGGLVVGGARKVDNCTSLNLTNGNWHMCSMTYDGAIIKRYVDGIMEKSTAATGELDKSQSFVFGRYGSETGYHCKEAYISDARIYATALSEEDILELYKTKMTIDKNGNLYARELVEA